MYRSCVLAAADPGSIPPVALCCLSFPVSLSPVEREGGDESYSTWKNSSLQMLAQTFLLTDVLNFHVFSVTILESGQNVNKHDIS